jgi:hypothetical protein
MHFLVVFVDFSILSFTSSLTFLSLAISSSYVLANDLHVGLCVPSWDFSLERLFKEFLATKCFAWYYISTHMVLPITFLPKFDLELNVVFLSCSSATYRLVHHFEPFWTIYRKLTAILQKYNMGSLPYNCYTSQTQCLLRYLKWLT